MGGLSSWSSAGCEQWTCAKELKEILFWVAELMYRDVLAVQGKKWSHNMTNILGDNEIKVGIGTGIRKQKLF